MKYTTQTAFNKMVTHLRRQRKRSKAKVNGVMPCMYRDGKHPFFSTGHTSGAEILLDISTAQGEIWHVSMSKPFQDSTSLRADTLPIAKKIAQGWCMRRIREQHERIGDLLERVSV